MSFMLIHTDLFKVKHIVNEAHICTVCYEDSWVATGKKIQELIEETNDIKRIVKIGHMHTLLWICWALRLMLV